MTSLGMLLFCQYSCPSGPRSLVSGKMEPVEQRAVINYLLKKGMTPMQIYSDMSATLGDSAVSYEIVKRWCREFKCGRTSCEDGGGPSKTVTTEENINKVHDIVMQDRRVTIREIVEETGFSFHTVHNILTQELGMKKLTARWVPRMLTPTQKRQRVLTSMQNLELFRSDKQQFLDRYVTMDESWIHHYDPETKIQSKEWKHHGSPPPRKFRVTPSAGKVMLAVFWDAKGVILVDYLHGRATITGPYYADLIEKLRVAIKEKRRGMLRRGVVLHHDNAPSHRSCVAVAAINKAGFELLEHPAYSPDLAPSDYSLFPKLKEHLRGKRFPSDDDVIQAVNEWFAEIPESFFRAAVEMLEHRWDKCISLRGDYVEK